MPRTITRERNERGLSTFLDSIRSLLISVQNLEDTYCSTEVIENLLLHLEESASTLVLISTHAGLNAHDAVLNSFKNDIDAVLAKIRSLCRMLTNYVDDSQEGQLHFSYTAPLSVAKGPGRPAVVVKCEQILFLRELHFSWAKIASLLGVSVSTLNRKRNELNIPDEDDSWTTISDERLEREVEEIRSLTPNIGQRRLLGALRARGIKIQRNRVRECLRRVDPLGTSLRWSGIIYRRKYSVPTPNSLWHIDGNHKLIRYRLVVHCCIDGYSRLLIYAHCATDNKAQTVLEQFMHGVSTFGLPSRVRSDHGLENIEVARYMLRNRGVARGSIITGSSVHNCRVERIHRDVYAGVLTFYAKHFNDLEEMGILDPMNEVNLFALHHVYLPRIRRSLMEFIQQWNNHSVSTERNLTPLQLYTAGMLNNMYSGHTATEEMFRPEELVFYGIDGDGAVPLEDEDYLFLHLM
ncbi:uncharacterized protein LOC114517591 [Dendronephthya gigantea]|uniref:uncharacterized protein LOC114517591 n=1 Tax=Dendronephthya gigantea TaxID=151771 RepID=UPI00106CF67C|nr:uncharacterized protein LOC114517591 [Dendronephthya gigantea]